MLMKEIEQSRFLNEVLERRIQRMKEIMKVISKHGKVYILDL